MRLQKTYVALLAKDLAPSEDCYTRLLGRKPDSRPMSTLVQWELGSSGGLQLSSDDSLSGQDGMSVVVDDVEAERSRLAGVGITLGESTEGTYSTLAMVDDPDGNKIILATPPSPSYPPA